MPEPVRVAMFGNGFARKVMLPCLCQVPGVRLAGIASPNLERARETALEFGIEEVAADYRDILARARPDLVFVAVPPHLHAEMAIEALRAGCHVVCEKPAAMRASETRQMLSEATARPDRVALIDHELRFLPARLAVRERLLAGDVGEVLRADYVLHSTSRRDPDIPWTWWSDRDQGGGALGAWGSHAVDALRWLCGEIREVRGQLVTWTPERHDPRTGDSRPVTSDEFAALWLRFHSGAIGTITLSSVEGDRCHRLTLAGSRGALHLEEQSPPRASIDGGAWREIPAPDDLPPSAELEIQDTDWARAFLRLARAVVRAIREGRTDVAPAATFEDGHRTQLVLDAARRSSEQARWISVGE